MEQTNPEAGVAQESRSIEDRVLMSLNQSEDQVDEAQPVESSEPSQPQEAKTAEQPEDQVTEELTPDDLEVEQKSEEQSAVDVFEITHNGQQVKLNRDELIQHAQQGFDYTRKVQAVAEKDRHIEAQLQVLSQVDQVRPHLQKHEAELRILEAQVNQYQKLDWLKWSSEDPVAAQQEWIKFDLLRQQHQQAKGEYDRAYQYVSGELAKVEQQRRNAEAQRLPEFIPEWKDTAKRQADEAAIVRHYADTYGIPPQELVQHLKGAVSLAVVYKAMRYDQLLKSKAEKVKQLRTAPPVTKPGAKSGSAKADKEMELRSRLKKTNSLDDAAAILFNRMK